MSGKRELLPAQDKRFDNAQQCSLRQLWRKGCRMGGDIYGKDEGHLLWSGKTMMGCVCVCVEGLYLQSKCYI